MKTFTVNVAIPPVCIYHNAKTKPQARSFVTTASLFELVKQFYSLGDDLYRTNPRLAPLKGNDAVIGMADTATTDPDQFVNRHNGVVIFVDKCSWQTATPTQLTLEFNEENEDIDTIPSGVGNGGTTLREARVLYEAGLLSPDAIVLVRFNVSFPSDWHAPTSKGLNTGRQVKWWPVALIEGKFDNMLSFMSEKSKNKKIFDELFNTRDDDKKTHDPTEIVRLLSLFDVRDYNYDVWKACDKNCETKKAHPIKAATNFGAVVKLYDDEDKGMLILHSFIDDFVWLDTTVRKAIDIMADKKNLVGMKEDQPSYKTFDGTPLIYTAPAPYVYPMLSAFRIAFDPQEKKPWGGYATVEQMWKTHETEILKVIKQHVNRVHKISTEDDGPRTMNGASRRVDIWDYPIKQLVSIGLI